MDVCSTLDGRTGTARRPPVTLCDTVFGLNRRGRPFSIPWLVTRTRALTWRRWTFGGYQALTRAYISNGLRKHLAEREAQRVKNSTVEEFSRKLIAHGLPEQATQKAVAEIRAST